MARHLRRAGEEVALLAVVDIGPGYRGIDYDRSRPAERPLARPARAAGARGEVAATAGPVRRRRAPVAAGRRRLCRVQLPVPPAAAARVLVVAAPSARPGPGPAPPLVRLPEALGAGGPDLGGCALRRRGDAVLERRHGVGRRHDGVGARSARRSTSTASRWPTSGSWTRPRCATWPSPSAGSWTDADGAGGVSPVRATLGQMPGPSTTRPDARQGSVAGHPAATTGGRAPRARWPPTDRPRRSAPPTWPPRCARPATTSRLIDGAGRGHRPVVEIDSPVGRLQQIGLSLDEIVARIDPDTDHRRHHHHVPPRVAAGPGAGRRR